MTPIILSGDLHWTASRSSNRAEAALNIVGDRDEVIKHLEDVLGYTSDNGFEIDAFTDQIDVYRVTRTGRRIRFTLMP